MLTWSIKKHIYALLYTKNQTLFFFNVWFFLEIFIEKTLFLKNVNKDPSFIFKWIASCYKKKEKKESPSNLKCATISIICFLVL